MISVVRASPPSKVSWTWARCSLGLMFSLMMTGPFTVLSTTTAIPWPTPMHIAAIP